MPTKIIPRVMRNQQNELLFEACNDSINVALSVRVICVNGNISHKACISSQVVKNLLKCVETAKCVIEALNPFIGSLKPPMLIKLMLLPL